MDHHTLECSTPANMDYSPAFSVNSDLTDEELDKYFASYVPLSNLPTPPLAKDHTAPNRVWLSLSPSTSTSASSAPASQTPDEFNSPELQAYATHLANLVPLNVSTHRPHVSVIQGFLKRASLPVEVVAFSACILDALSSRFAATWREVLVPSNYVRDVKNFLKTDSSQNARVNPDVIILAALSLAHGFLVDRLRSSLHWSLKESKGSFTVPEIESTKRAILQDMDYGLFRISEDRVQRRQRAMQLAITLPPAAPMAEDYSVFAKHSQSRHTPLMGSGVWSHGVQTPEPSP